MTMDIRKRNHVHVTGNGEQTIVFAHGFGSSQQAWKQVVKAFEEEYKVVLFDYVGSGSADKHAYSSARYQSLEGYAEDLIEVCDDLKLTNVIFIGHSVSGMIGTIAAGKKPELFRQMIMIAASPRYLNDEGYHGGFDEESISGMLDMMEKNFNEWAKYLAPVTSKNEDRPELAQNFEQQLLSNDQMIAREFAQATFLVDMRAELKRVETPVVIMQPSDDTIVPHEAALYLANEFPDSEFVVLQATGHNPHISHPEEVIKYIRKYIAVEAL
ncbi:alpha/beta fold hydrolase [Jeotgalibacillus terrae]|uniref:Alpha/beta fold hydrolase n=1 Tax=Jeotgalibacillus terrae TaxID=587735 RepID=A0ABW5ZHA9_9BACL|nr:alpha/beta hydrolase [Jeotgalibacillus terrae]MBM7579350.1 sigma-B regulation protein RsbQ [Jeotgalibacillus terrae]